MQAEEKREIDGSSPAATDEARAYDAFSYDLAAASLSSQSGATLVQKLTCCLRKGVIR